MNAATTAMSRTMLALALVLPVSAAQADVLGGALGGALFGGLIGGGDGAAIGALVGGVAGAAHESSRRQRYEASNRARYEQQRMDWERQRAAEERRMHEERMRMQQQAMVQQQQMQQQQARQAAAAAAPVLPQAPAAAPARGGNVVADVQRSLIVLGYNPGGVDGQMGPATVAAIRQYQTDKGLNPTGQASPELLAHMRAAGG